MLILDFISIVLTLNISFATSLVSPIREPNSSGTYKYFRSLNKHHGSVRDTTRCHDMRCALICPINVIFAPGGPNNGNHVTENPSSKLTSRQTSPLPAKGTTKTYRNIFESPNHKSRQGKHEYFRRLFNKHKVYGRNTLVHYFKIKTGTNKRSYNYRQLLPNGCHVICNNQQAMSGQNTQTTQGGQSQEDESDEESSDEVNDKPIEATVSPGENKGFKLPNQRPFGPVDFIGMDDFGPDGWPAMDIAGYYERKTNRQKHQQLL